MAEHDTPYDGIKCSRWSCCHWTLRKGIAKGRVCSLLWLPGRVRIPTPFWIPCSEGLMRLDEFAPRLPLLFFFPSSSSFFFFFQAWLPTKVAIKKVYRCIKLIGVVKFLFREKKSMDLFIESVVNRYMYFFSKELLFFSDFFFLSTRTKAQSEKRIK